MSSDPTKRIKAIIKELGYPFHKFNLKDFTQYIEWEITRAEIILMPTSLGGKDGYCIRTPARSYIAYEPDTDSTHQLRNILYGLGHIILQGSLIWHPPDEREIRLFVKQVIQEISA